MLKFLGACVLIISATVSACGATDRASNVGATVTDSAGVTIVSNSAPKWTASQPWTIDSVPFVTIGEGADSSQNLSAISAHLRLSDGTIALVNNRRELRFYDSAGKFLRLAGRAGSGPGEFQTIAGMYSCKGDSIVVGDFSRRVSIWNASGTFVRETKWTGAMSGKAPTIAGASDNCSAVLFRDALNSAPDIQYQTRLNWYQFDRSRADSILTFPGNALRLVTYNGLPIKQPIVWDNQPQFAAGVDRIIVGLGNSPEYKVFDLHGKLQRIVRWTAGEPEPVTITDRNAYDSARAEYIKRSPEDSIALPPLSMQTIAKTKPFYARIQIDHAGNTWLCQCSDRIVLFNAASNIREGESWLVFDSTGVQLGSVKIPKGLNMQRIGENDLGGVWLDSDDVPSLRLYRIRKPGS